MAEDATTFQGFQETKSLSHSWVGGNEKYWCDS